MRTHQLRATAVGATALGLTVLGTAATAEPIDDALQTEWDGPTVHLAWDGSTYTSATESFVDTPVTVPGDMAGRTLTVINDGPCSGTLYGYIVNVVTLDPDAPDVHHNPAHVDPDGSGAAVGDPYKGAGDQGNFYDDLMLRWETATETDGANFTTLNASDPVEILAMPIAKGGTTDITIVYEFPYDATSGNKANVAERLAAFDVYLEIKGDECRVTPPLPDTGADMALLGLASVVMVAGGLGVRAAARRRQA